MSSYVPPFPNLTFNTVFTAALSYDCVNDSESIECQIIAVFAVTSTSFYNSSLQANVVSRIKIDGANMKLVELFLLPSPTTNNNVSTIQLTPVLHLRNLPHADTLINTLKNSMYFSRSLKDLTVHQSAPKGFLSALENLVALEVLELQFSHSIPEAKAQELSVIARLPSLIQLDLDLGPTLEKFGFFDLLGDLENNSGFRKLRIRSTSDSSLKSFQTNFARLCARNLLTHLSFGRFFTDDDLDVLVDAKLTKLQSLELRGNAEVTSGKIADAIIACSSSLTTVHVSCISDDDLLRCAEYLTNIVELRISSPSVNGSFLHQKGSCFASRLEILQLAGSSLSDAHLQDGFKHLTSLRQLDISRNRNFDGATSLQHLTAATFFEELLLETITSATFTAVGKLTQLRSLNVVFTSHDVTSDDVVHLKNLVNLRKLSFTFPKRATRGGILKIAESFPKLEHVSLGHDHPFGTAKLTRDEVAYLLEKCWPLVRNASFEYDDACTVMPYLRGRFPHVSFGYAAERSVPVIREITSSSSTSQVTDEHDS